MEEAPAARSAVSLQSLAVLAIRLVAVWVFIKAIDGLALLAQPWDDDGRIRATQHVLAMVSSVLPMFLGFLLWSNAEWIAARAVARHVGALEAPWGVHDLQRAAVAIIGIVVLTASIPEMAWYSALFVALNTTRDTFLGPVGVAEDAQRQLWDVTGKANFAAAVARLSIGLACLLKPNAVAALVGRAERGPAPDQGDDSEAPARADE